MEHVYREATTKKACRSRGGGKNGQTVFRVFYIQTLLNTNRSSYPFDIEINVILIDCATRHMQTCSMCYYCAALSFSLLLSPNGSKFFHLYLYSKSLEQPK